MSPGVVQVRADICGDCPTPCALQRDPAAHADPCASCPLSPPRWGPWDCSPSAPPPSLPAPGGDTAPAGMRGLGDLVALVADPIGRALGLDKAKCGCAARQDALNRAVPFHRPPAP